MHSSDQDLPSPLCEKELQELLREAEMKNKTFTSTEDQLDYEVDEEVAAILTSNATPSPTGKRDSLASHIVS